MPIGTEITPLSRGPPFLSNNSVGLHEHAIAGKACGDSRRTLMLRRIVMDRLIYTSIRSLSLRERRSWPVLCALRRLSVVAHTLTVRHGLGRTIGRRLG